MGLKLSVIVPIYKVEQYLCKCVDSLLNQDLSEEEYEIILVDDGSPDRCGAICEDYAINHPNVKVIHRKNGGLSSARNSGIEVARGQYVQFVDSDDYINTEMYEKLPNAELKFYANWTHAPYISNPDDLARALKTLVERLK